MAHPSPRPIVPEDFAVPRELTTRDFRLEPLGPRHNEADHAAWTSGIEHIRTTPGFEGRGWPPPDGMSEADNLRDLERHADDFARRSGFTYTVLETTPEGGEDVVGCVYIYPSRSDPGHIEVRSWVRADRAALDRPLYEAVRDWLASRWPFPEVRYPGR
ncbi:N-acetyltransferase [Streptomyces sp. SAJ15]|uniref:N-acetyltransferase n=1 Tax=Streptomyces sp. SAJ15 TaxID=2011095 RepID=UPI001184A11F|nr:N-acetyltransferase [Streptomyces sp. SAJ15]TVL89280.1 twin-arginine translocation pathway signal protein [Streptomyces sp. SAJ15]